MKMKMSAGIKQASRAIFLLPSLFTLTNLYLGYLSITATFDAVAARVSHLIAVAMDGLDGLVARLIRGSSDFGIQLDSLPTPSPRPGHVAPHLHLGPSDGASGS
jgi:phosphatidylglycerophosphate synthase